MKSPITIDFVNSIIIVNAAYAKKASNPFSQEYEQLQRVRADYPTYIPPRDTCIGIRLITIKKTDKSK